MANELTILSQGNICRFRLSFGSLVRLPTRLGFYVGISCVPVMYLAMLLGPNIVEGPKPIPSSEMPFILTFLTLTMPVIGMITFAFYGVLTYPFYRWLKVQTYFGEFELLEKPQPRILTEPA